jgi:hypothetical protein
MTMTPAPPALYGNGSEWAEDRKSPWYVPPELRSAYAAAVPQPEVALAVQEASGKGFHSLRLLPRAEAERMCLDGRATMPSYAPPRGDDSIRVRVPITADEWLHLRRTELAEQAAKQTELPPVPRNICVACGDSEVAAVGARTTFHPAVDAAARIGLRGMVCPPCSRTAALLEAEQVLADGRTRLAAVREAAGLDASGLTRGERDRQAVLEQVAAARG